MLMGLFSLSPVQRFLDSASREHVYAGTKILVSGFLQAMQAQNIYFKYGMHPLMREMMLKSGMFEAESQTIDMHGSVLSYIGGDALTRAGDSKIVVEFVDVAVETCATRMANLPVTPRISRGISFGIDCEPDGPSTSWHLVLHRGPLPLLQIRLSDMGGFRPSKKWLDMIVNNKSSHVINSNLGGGDQLFLSEKRARLFPHSKGNASDDAVAAGQRLRELCHEVWQKQSGNAASLYKLSSWRWRQKRFIRKFDQMLLEQAGSENLAAILKPMETRLESWLSTCDY